MHSELERSTSRLRTRKSAVTTGMAVMAAVALPATADAQQNAVRAAEVLPPAIAVAVRALPDPPRIDGKLDDLASIGDLFSSPSTNTFVVKMNYWLSP